MARAVDPKRTRKALKALAALKAAAEDGAQGEGFSAWEDTFITEVSARLEKYGSAFNDFGKGDPEEALSRLQRQKLQELRKKSKKTANGKVSEGAETPPRRSSFRKKSFPYQNTKLDE